MHISRVFLDDKTYHQMEDIFTKSKLALLAAWQANKSGDEGFIKRLFNFSSLSAIRVISSVYLKLLIFLLVILIPACDSSSPAFHMMYSTYKLNKQGGNIQLWHTSFPIRNQSVDPRLVLTVASWPTYGFLRRQERWSGIPISLRIFQSLLWSTQSFMVVRVEP